MVKTSIAYSVAPATASGHEASPRFTHGFLPVQRPIFHDPGHRSSQSLHLPPDFRYHPNHLTYGAFDDSCYDTSGSSLGPSSCGDVLAQAGIKGRKFIDWYRKKQEQLAPRAIPPSLFLE